MAVCPVGLTYVRCVIVEFPGSKAQLSDLPGSCFPVVPVSWTFTTLLKDANGLERKLRITHHQLPIQPAFAMTGHSAQGKTLPSVLVNLHEGGFRAYIAASRAQTRTSLCITQAPLPADLLQEVRHFEAIEVNTCVWCGLRDGDLVPVPDAESDMAIPPVSYTANIVQEQHKSTKHQRNEESASSTFVSSAQSAHDSTHGPHKRQRLEDTTMELAKYEIPSRLASGNTSPALGPGCTWTESDWSCAYNVVFMLLFHLYQDAMPRDRSDWHNLGELSDALL
ncbi:hypothetical protein F4604DRAFT_1679334 [Suillus subluteus]|nr:hypothetical protein F4604DRAFT_1679334 [Suillus subluteus]